MKDRIVKVLLVVGAVAWVGRALAQDVLSEPGLMDRPMRQMPSMERSDFMRRLLDNPRVMNALALTEQQKAQIKEKGLLLQKEVQRIRAELDKAGMEQAKLVSNDSTDMKTLMAAVEKTGKIRTEMAKVQLKHLIEVRSLLTADQRAKLPEFMHKAHERRGEEGAGKRQPSAERRHSGEKRAAPEEATPPQSEHPLEGGGGAPVCK